MSSDIEENWVDVTDIISNASKSLTFDENFIADSSFSLFEAMSAVEIMDVKMDSGSNLEKNSSTDLDGIMNVLIPDSNEVTLQLFETLVIYETSFLEGASVLESTHQCILLHEKSWNNLDSTSYPVGSSIYNTLSYCKGLNKSLFYLNKAILASDIYEEEDFSPATTSHLCESLDDTEILEGLEKGMQHDNMLLSAYMKLRLTLFRTYKTLSEWIHQTVLDSGRTKSVDAGFDSSEQSVFMKSTETNATLVIDNIDRLLSSVEKSEFQIKNVSSHKNYPSVAFAYSVNLVRLTQTSPLRTINFKSFFQSLTYLKGVMKEILSVCELFQTFFQKEISAIDCETLFQATLELNKKKMNILPRSLFRAVLSFYAPHMPVLVENSMRIRKIPEKYLDFELVKSRWIFSIGHVINESFKSLVSDRNKLNIKVENIIPLWSVLAQEASFVDRQCMEAFDSEYQEWFSCFIALFTTALMDVAMELLTEMELLAINELDYFYFYWDFICSNRSVALEKLRIMAFENSDASKSSAGNNAMQISAEELFSKSKSLLFKSQFRILVGCNVLSLIKKKDSPYTKWSRRFDQRFRAFNQISNPPYLSYFIYEQSVKNITSKESDVVKNALSVIKDASEFYKRARLYVDIFRATTTGIKNPNITVSTYADKIAHTSGSQWLLKCIIGGSVSALRSTTVLNDLKSHPLQLQIKESDNKHFPIFDIKA